MKIQKIMDLMKLKTNLIVICNKYLIIRKKTDLILKIILLKTYDVYQL